MTSGSDALSAILASWHKIEFFIPFNLNSVKDNQDDDQISMFIFSANPKVPANFQPPEGKKHRSAILWLGLFDKDEVSRVTESLAPETHFSRLDREERSEDEPSTQGSWAGQFINANTCMAKIRLGAAGEPDFTSVEVSTLPWAIGKTLKHSLGALSWDLFDSDRKRLAGTLANFEEERRLTHGLPDQAAPLPLAPQEIIVLRDILCQWADFIPAPDLPLALMQVNFGKDKAQGVEQARIAKIPPASTRENEEEYLDEEDEAAEKEKTLPEIGILNSFYLTDLELAQASIAADTVPESLKQYLTELPVERRIDLSTDAGHKHIIAMLHPSRMNTGRWPSNPAHAMSLMQQFAINSAFDHLKDRGVFSVNGPPGTGKTTLLRDIFAENITRRARVLASLKTPADAFSGVLRVDISGDQPRDVRQLIPTLTGYEMVVTSYNNTAVENISKELPQADSLDLPKGEDFSYLRPVAHKLVAESAPGKFDILPEEKRPWGLIACALGNSKNRQHFRNAVFFNETPDEAIRKWSEKRRAEGDCPITLWQWRKGINSKNALPKFKEATKIFRNLDKQVQQRRNDLAAFANLHKVSRTGFLQQELANLNASLTDAQRNEQTCKINLESVQSEIETGRRALEELREDERQLDRLKPSFWKSLFRSTEAQAHATRVKENAEAILALSHALRARSAEVTGTLNPDLEQARGNVVDLREKVADCNASLERQGVQLEEYKVVFPDVTLFDLDTEIETEPLQRSGLWHDRKLNILRSDLFKAALKLHEAWLAAIMVDKSICYWETMWAISQLIGGKRIAPPEHLLALWQNFFMIVPVVSTTFASFARQFRGLGPDSLGWVFVDEAGQAVPQAAAGAMYRARRAVIIGDPLQIEPVFTLSEPLVTAICDLSPYTSSGRCSPATASVQTLADAANPFGMNLDVHDDQSIWVGSPLRVHRRCLDPMFSLANRIAYAGTMIHASTRPDAGEDKAPFLGPSAWFQIPGRVNGKQTVPEQIDFVSELLLASVRRDGELPDLYVISPFKEIKLNLQRRLRDKTLWQTRHVSPPRGLNEWLGKRIGTVHTFQGKEEDTVIMILGTDADTQGAAQWAASKPNILNVALTRAKRRFYMVGDQDLWGRLRYFNDAAAILPQISLDTISRNLIQAAH